MVCPDVEAIIRLFETFNSDLEDLHLLTLRFALLTLDSLKDMGWSNGG